MRFEELTEFRKDMKRLLKRYRTLEKDLEVIKQVLTVLPEERTPFSYRIADLGVSTCIIKVRKIACRALSRFFSKVLVLEMHQTKKSSLLHKTPKGCHDTST